MIHEFPNGMTVAELKKLVADWPEKDQNGDDNEVWLQTSPGASSPVVTFAKLNERDIYLAPSQSVWDDR